MQVLIAGFLKNESGATAIEYGLIAAGISGTIIAVVLGIGLELSATFNTIPSPGFAKSTTTRLEQRNPGTEQWTTHHRKTACESGAPICR